MQTERFYTVSTHIDYEAHAEIERQTQEFLAKGGVIDHPVCEPMTAKKLKDEKAAARGRKGASGLRSSIEINKAVNNAKIWNQDRL